MNPCQRGTTLSQKAHIITSSKRTTVYAIQNGPLCDTLPFNLTVKIKIQNGNEDGDTSLLEPITVGEMKSVAVATKSGSMHQHFTKKRQQPFSWVAAICRLNAESLFQALKCSL